LDLFAKAIQQWRGQEPFGLRLLVHRDKKGREHKEGDLEKLAGDAFVVSAADVLLPRRWVG
jgi:hypothetical protein